MNRTFSEDDAQRIFALAAERQQAAQAHDRPQLSLADLEEAGQAAGLDPAHIRAAAADLLRPDRVPVHRTFLGTPVEIRKTQVFARRLSPAVRQKLLAEVRRTFNAEGVLTELPNGFEWASAKTQNQSPFRVFVEDEEGGSRVTLERNKWNQVIGFGSGAGSMLITFMVITASAFLSNDVEPALIGVFFIVAALLFGIGSFYGIRRQSQKEIKQFNTLMAQVESWHQAGGAEADPSLSAPEAPAVDLDGRVEGYVMGSPEKSTRDGKRIQRH